MKCKQCSKIIPDGFTDCPWCGATTVTAASVNSASSQPAVSSAHNLLLAVSVASSGILFLVLSYFATARYAGPLTLQNCGYFIGRCAGAIVLAAIVVLGYRRIRGAKLRGPIQILVILTLSSLLTILTLAIPVQPRLGGVDASTVRRYSDVVRSPKAPNAPPPVQTKWDPATRSLLKDIVARNQQYVSEISALDETAKPLYAPESFRDAATMQQMIDQLHTRLAVADKYADWQPLFSKMKDYVAAANASEDEKHKFMDGYEANLPQTLAACKAISDKEHAWLQASVDLYQFTLSKDGAYVWQSDNLSFKRRADSEMFRQKFLKARTLNTEFLKAYWQVRQAEDAMMARMGLQESDLLPAP
jgi:hypothetical protein